MNCPLSIHLAQGINGDKKKKKSDSMLFTIMGNMNYSCRLFYYFIFYIYLIYFIEKPSHGKLNEYTTSSEYITYIPQSG